MTRFYDGKKILTISMTDTNNGNDWEYDFFDAGTLEYNEELNAHKVDDVDYLIDYATEYANGTNTDIEYQYDENGEIILPPTTVDYTVEDM